VPEYGGVLCPKNGRKEIIVKEQMALFEEVKVEVEKPPPPTTVRIGKRETRVPLYKKRREALDKLKALSWPSWRERMSISASVMGQEDTSGSTT
jgi:hypothetical protein